MKKRKKLWRLGAGALLLLALALFAARAPTAQPEPAAGLSSLAAEPEVCTSDFQADTNETVVFRQAALQIPAAWSAAVADGALYLSPDGTAPEEEEAVVVRAVPLEIPAGGLAESTFRDTVAEAFFSAYRGGGEYVDFTVLQKEYAAAQDGGPELFLCAFEAVQGDVRVSRSAGFFIVGGELYALEVPYREGGRYNCAGDAYQILCTVSAAPEPAAEPSPEQASTSEPTPDSEPAPTPELTPTPEPTPAPEPTRTPEPAPAAASAPEVSPTPAPAPEPSAGTVPVSGEADYVLNTNTKKFHVPSCSSVKQMKESNKQLYTGTRDALIAQGYDPCKNCNP